MACCLLTGCMRVSRECIFTGANNMQVMGLNDPAGAALMGFTEAEVMEMLDYYGLSGRLADVRHWYNGYSLAGVRIYNPWSITHYCSDAAQDARVGPSCYWVNTSANEVLSTFCQVRSQTMDCAACRLCWICRMSWCPSVSRCHFLNSVPEAAGMRLYLPCFITLGI